MEIFKLKERTCPRKEGSLEHEMKVSGQPHTVAALYLGKESPSTH